MKKRIRKTGEIVDVIAWYNLMGAERDMNDSVSYIDSKGNECVKVEGLNLAWDFEDVEESLKSDIDEESPKSDIDWEQRRYNTAKDALAAIMGRISYDPLTQCACSGLDGERPNPYHGIAQISVEAADALITELKKGGEK